MEIHAVLTWPVHQATQWPFNLSLDIYWIFAMYMLRTLAFHSISASLHEKTLGIWDLPVRVTICSIRSRLYSCWNCLISVQMLWRWDHLKKKSLLLHVPYSFRQFVEMEMVPSSICTAQTDQMCLWHHGQVFKQQRTVPAASLGCLE